MGGEDKKYKRRRQDELRSLLQGQPALMPWGYTILYLSNKALSWNWAVTLIRHFKSLLQWDWTEETAHSSNRGNCLCVCPLHPVSSGRGGAVPTQRCISSDSHSGVQVNPFKTLLRTQGTLTLLLVRVLKRNRTNIFIMHRDVEPPLWLTDKERVCLQCRRWGFNLRVRKIP